jgi:hypothetical protein
MAGEHTGSRRLGGLRIADARVPTPGFAALILGTAAWISGMLLVRRRPLLAAAY